MNLSHLRYFVELAHTKHYTQAAAHLCITQPSLSHAIAQLEAELGVPLFEKEGRSIVLTRFGQQFLQCVQQSLDTLDEGVGAIQRVVRGEGMIRLGLLRTLGIEYVPSLAAQFLRDNPGKNIRFTFHTGTTQQLLEDLQAKRCDLAFCSQPPQSMGMTAVPVQEQDLVLIVPRDHPLTARHTVTLADTLPYPQIFFSQSSGLRNVVDRLFEQIGGTPDIAYETEEDQVIAGLVAQGFGISVVPYMDLLLRLNVKILQISEPVWERKFYLVSNPNAYESPAVRQFRQFVLHTNPL